MLGHDGDDHDHDEPTNDSLLLIIKIVATVVILGISLLFGFFPLFWYFNLY